MIKKLFTILILSCFILTACGDKRDSNKEPKEETKVNNLDQKVPNTGNERVNEENDVGIPKKDESINDPTIQKPAENND
ncbi:hypothetical protein SAMN05518871_103252 [Psychrobacillus sp. OK028]|uniref:hypothetical protein n=1 Tax=Psychrobacillus sp. OK028 TaxID=1884359 RepID=UPI00087F53AF|nr:hypothetical protein [Psychrobacillus sp. OK028]SDN08765.1 hypothetical protein SAMN05518871_103252 [Psychrobacillus sp. OK028]